MSWPRESELSRPAREGSVSDHARRLLVRRCNGYDPPTLRGMKRGALPELPIDSGPGAA